MTPQEQQIAIAEACGDTRRHDDLLAHRGELTLEGQTVLDPFMGSGSTGIAAARLHRNFIGIERDAAHYKTACDRIAHELDGALL